MMVARTIAIDEAVRAAASPQVVILGAGLDGRAWRMPELRDVTVFEVDHPDSQREKQARAAALQRIAREVRFVPVDFARDRLDDALAAAGHDPARPTTWVWEGVVMYLERADIEATLAVIQRRSAPGSRLVLHVRALGRCCCALIGLLVRRLGEPLRSLFTPEQMRALLARHGFAVARDEEPAGDRRPAVRRPRTRYADHEAHARRHRGVHAASVTISPRARPASIVSTPDGDGQLEAARAGAARVEPEHAVACSLRGLCEWPATTTPNPPAPGSRSSSPTSWIT